MTHPSPIRVHAALFTVALMFSANYVISKLAMRAFAPMSFAWLRVAGAALLLAWLARGREPLSRGDARKLVLYAILGVVINQSLFLSGLQFTTVQVAALLITTMPVFALGTAIVFGSERPSAAKLGGIALAAVGALLVLGGEGLTGTARSVFGGVLIVINCLSFSIYLVISKPMMARIPAIVVVSRMFAASTVLMLPFAALPLAREPWGEIPPRAWLSLVLVILGPTVLAYLLNAWALQYTDSSVVAVYTYVQPILGTLLAALLLGEELRPTALAAGVLIFAGVWLAGRRRSSD